MTTAKAESVCRLVRSSERAGAAKVTTAMTRLAGGNFSNVKGVGSGGFEFKIDFGPGYRISFGKDGERLGFC